MRTRTARIATAATVVSAMLVGALVTVATGPPALASQPGAGRPPSSEDRLQTAVDDMHDLGVVGVQGFTRGGNHIARARSGVASLDNHAPVPVNGYFRMGVWCHPAARIQHRGSSRWH